MAKAADVLENPFTGQALTFRRTTAETAGELLEVESSWARAGQEPPVHHHPSQDERFEVLEGELRAQVGGVERALHAGDVLDVPARTPHAMWNPGPGQARAAWQTALRTEAFFEMVWGLAQKANANDTDSPGPDEAAAMMREYEAEFRLGPPDSA